MPEIRRSGFRARKPLKGRFAAGGAPTALQWSRSTLYVALRVNVNQRHVKGNRRPALSRHGTHLVSQVRIGARNIGRVERLEV